MKIFLAFVYIILASEIPEKEPCHPDYPFMSIGDYNASSTNFMPYIKKNDFVILIISSTSCKECCQFEEMFAKMNEVVFKNKTMHNIDYKILRMNLMSNLWIRNELNINHIPYLHLYYKTKSYYLIDHRNPYRIHNQVQRIINPYEVLHTFESFKTFIAQNVNGRKRVLRKLCILFIYDVVEYNDKYKEFMIFADTVSWREDLRPALITNKPLILQIYNTYKLKYFPEEDELNSLLLISKQNDFEDTDTIYKVSLDNLNVTILNWFVERSIEPVERISIHNADVISSNNKPIILAYLDIQTNI